MLGSKQNKQQTQPGENKLWNTGKDFVFFLQSVSFCALSSGNELLHDASSYIFFSYEMYSFPLPLQ
jgi:hypothetical protein